METLIKRSYDSIVDRGLITSETNVLDFIKKFKEESEELKMEVIVSTMNGDLGITNRQIEESIDIINVLLNMLHHYGINFEYEFIKCIQRNENRAREKRIEKNKK